jgi:hypothetical protein
MINHVFPITIVDNFLDDPYLAIELANKQEFFTDDEGRWPGSRSNNIAEFAPKFFERTLNKFFAIFYEKDSFYKFTCSMQFQKVGSKYTDGWAHIDSGSLISGILYLNVNPSINSGTSICMPNSIEWDNLNIKNKIENYKNGTDDPIKRQENNDQFHESIIIKNKFNRLIAFDSHLLHKANFEKNIDNDDRLTIVFFVHNFLSEKEFPLLRSRQVM